MTDADRITMARGIMAAFWKDTLGPPTFDMRWETCGEMRQKVWLNCADAAFATGRALKASRMVQSPSTASISEPA